MRSYDLVIVARVGQLAVNLIHSNGKCHLVQSFSVLHVWQMHARVFRANPANMRALVSTNEQRCCLLLASTEEQPSQHHGEQPLVDE
jgi:hypothetical protein